MRTAGRQLGKNHLLRLVLFSVVLDGCVLCCADCVSSPFPTLLDALQRETERQRDRERDSHTECAVGAAPLANNLVDTVVTTTDAPSIRNLDGEPNDCLCCCCCCPKSSSFSSLSLQHTNTHKLGLTVCGPALMCLSPTSLLFFFFSSTRVAGRHIVLPPSCWRHNARWIWLRSCSVFSLCRDYVD